MSADIEHRHRNARILNRIFDRASRPGFWGKIEISFEDGKLRDHFKIESTLRTRDKNDEEIQEAISAVMDPDQD